MNVLELLFPPRCVGCGQPGVVMCRACEPSVGVVTPPLCARCGRPWEEEVAACPECPPAGVDVVRSPFLYEGPVGTAIKQLKFGGWRALARHLAGAMTTVWEAEADAVTWVPLAPQRRRRRGFDQAEVLARAVARRLDLPSPRMLRRVWDTPAQARQTAVDRRRALREAFEPVRASPRRILLVDDVMTTGGTVAACAAALRRAGAERVLVATAARAVRDPAPARCFRPSGGAGLGVAL